MSKEVSLKKSLLLLAGTIAGSGVKSIIIFLFVVRPYIIPFVYATLFLWMWAVLRAEKSHFSRPSGWKLRRFADLCFSTKTFTQVLEPTLSDMQKEHFDALAEGRPWKARMALVRGYWAFWSAVVAQLPIPFARLVYKIWKTTNTGS